MSCSSCCARPTSAPRDRLWFLGDLVNRGPKSLEVLRFVRELGERAVTVLGNHDLHLLAQFEGTERPRKDDTFRHVLEAPDGPELVAWLRRRPMMHAEGDYAMVHAGLLPQWSIDTARSLGEEVEQALRAPNYREFLAHMYGDQPDRWDDSLGGLGPPARDRQRHDANALLRPPGPDGFARQGNHAGAGLSALVRTAPEGEANARSSATGRSSDWSCTRAAVGLDSGCVWGGALSALRLEDRTLYQVPCAGYQAPGGDG